LNDRKSGFITGVAAGLAAAAAIVVLTLALTEDDFGDLPLNEQAQEVIADNYFRAVDDEQLEQDSVRAMVADLRKRYDDRFSHYFDPEQLEEFDAATSGEFSGVGLTVNEVPRGLRVADVLPESPAAAAELAVGDVITAVDGESIAGDSSDISTAKIKGEPGTEVELRVDPAGGGPARELTLERATVRLPVANGRIVRTPSGEEIAYVHFAGFSKGAHGELRAEIERLYREGATGLILDLRANGGGLLNEAVLSSSLFVEDGDVVTTRSRTRGEQVYEAVGGAFDPRPTVVLINRDTASAAEILAAAIQSYDLGTVVGEPSFGKGTFQEVIHLPAGGALDLTIGEYLTADGISLAGEGVQPEVRAVDRRGTRRDEALDAAVRTLAPELQ
jgi:carboxyl-terminal processing protease